MKKLRDIFKIKKPKSKKKDVFDLSLRDVGRATKKLAKNVVVKTIKDW